MIGRMWVWIPVVNLIKHFTIVIYDSRVIWLGNCPCYDSRVVNYNRKMFIRLATGQLKSVPVVLGIRTRCWIHWAMAATIMALVLQCLFSHTFYYFICNHDLFQISSNRWNKKGDCGTVWPDLANFCLHGRFLKIHGKIREV